MNLKEIEDAARAAHNNEAGPEVGPDDVLKLVARIRELERTLDQVVEIASGKLVVL